MYLFCKRFLDIIVSASLLVFLSPLFMVIALAIKGTSKGPVFYRGERAGLHGHAFFMLKFRTMVANAENVGGFSTAINDPRFIKGGRILRKYKLDELPQLINVFWGQMSLVGPRPQVFYYVNQYNDDELKILTMKPGITDIASIYFSDMDVVLGSGDVDHKYETEIEPKKNELRLLYIKKASLVFDLKILFYTFAKLIKIPTPNELFKG